VHRLRRNSRPAYAEPFERFVVRPGNIIATLSPIPVHIHGELALEPHAEGEKDDDGHGPPDDCRISSGTSGASGP